MCDTPANKLTNAARIGFRQATLAGLVAMVTGLLSAYGGAAQASIDVQSEMECLALNIYFEARGEPDLGKSAVAHVVLNRVSDPRYPDTICEVVKQGGQKSLHRCQFSWWCDGRSDLPRDLRAWRKSQALARRIFWGYTDDPTAGALWYHADSVRPIWRKALKRGPEIGRHIFYANDRPVGPIAASFTSP